MSTTWSGPLAIAAIAAVFAGCASIRSLKDKPEPVVLVGELQRSEIELAEPRWVEAQVSAEVDAEAARRLVDADPGAEVAVFLGTWCGDSRREVGRLWRAFDDLSGPEGAFVPPFEIEYIGVDREKEEPVERTGGLDIQYVPTVIVYRDGQEVGRIIESAPAGIEGDLADLLSGRQSGVISGRTDLEPSEEPSESE